MRTVSATEAPMRRLFGDWRWYWVLLSFPIVVMLIPICFVIQCWFTAWAVSAHLQNSAETLAAEFKTWKAEVKIDD